MKNRIEEIALTKDRAEKARKNRELKRVLENPAEREKVVKEFHQALGNSGKRIEAIREQIELKMKLKEVSEIISISYIAKNYFNKTRQWLYQRINGNIVNGKRKELTPEQLKTLDFALKDISQKIGSLSI